MKKVYKHNRTSNNFYSVFIDKAELEKIYTFFILTTLPQLGCHGNRVHSDQKIFFGKSS